MVQNSNFLCRKRVRHDGRERGAEGDVPVGKVSCWCLKIGEGKDGGDCETGPHHKWKLIELEKPLSLQLAVKPYGLLNLLEVLGKPWESIGIDFFGPLPESSNRDGTFDSITVVSCLMSGMVHPIPSRTTYTARQMAELVFEQIYKLHGLQKSIVSDRDVLFTSTFWQRLHQLMGTKLKMSSAYHPET